jgi:hypothetical protein
MRAASQQQSLVRQVVTASSLYLVVNLDLVLYNLQRLVRLDAHAPAPTHVPVQVGLDVLPQPFDMDASRSTFALAPPGMQWIGSLSGLMFRLIFTTSLIVANYIGELGERVTCALPTRS